MINKTIILMSFIAVILLLHPACGMASKTPTRTWEAELIKTVEGFDVPECTLFDPVEKCVYVANIQTQDAGYWVFDDKGFISRLNADGQIQSLLWKTGGKNNLSAPKGMCLLNGKLYVADITNVWIFSANNKAESFAVAGSQNLNDIATDGKTVYISDTAAGKIYILIDPQNPAKGFKCIEGPTSLNGLTFFKGRMFGVSWKLHEVYELDASGKKPPKPFGLEKYFSNLDGIEVLEDGTFIVSDFVGNKICTISPDRKTVRDIISLESPADIGLDKKRKILYVPQFKTNQVAVFKLRWN